MSDRPNCPACGAAPYIDTTGGDDRQTEWSVYCANHDCDGPFVRSATEEDAERGWIDLCDNYASELTPTQFKCPQCEKFLAEGSSALWLALQCPGCGWGAFEPRPKS